MKDKEFLTRIGLSFIGLIIVMMFAWVYLHFNYKLIAQAALAFALMELTAALLALIFRKVNRK